ncbi:Mad3/Bub1 homology region 1 [Dillenia turbinata]|uniref:Mad3/Bub1 homology region 1 n=1 Tax=Dillenia turbinata TaxID=194707 RepID=A0AAN8VHI2_9MAGN
MANLHHNDIFTSLISDIKSYSGTDPLLPWLRGIRKMKDTLPGQLLKQKLPRFLQKCAQTFESDNRYKDDLRYIRVWIQLMDYVEDQIGLLRAMEINRIGMKRALFYQAYALYFEKMKKFDDADKMYHLGVQNFAEPVDELHKSYEQFLRRMERHKNKRIQKHERRTARRPLAEKVIPHSKDIKNNENMYEVEECKGEGTSKVMPLKKHDHVGAFVAATPTTQEEFGEKMGPREQLVSKGQISERQIPYCSDDTVVVKFVDTAIVGKSEAEDACHHGLVEPTINMKEAMNAINSMFREPIEPLHAGRRSKSTRPQSDQNSNKRLEVFIDDSLGNGSESENHKVQSGLPPQLQAGTDTCNPQQEAFKIFTDDDDDGDEVEGINGKNDDFNQNGVFVFPNPDDSPDGCSEDMEAVCSPRGKLGEDTVVCRFVGSAILDEPVVENVCHHGLVEPTINLKEAMDDINNMFGKPIDFLRTRRPKEDKAPERKNDSCGFSILQDDDLEPQQKQPQQKPSQKFDEHDLFEQTVCTKEAMDEINKMFGMPLDF